ncbi:thioredoxin-like protein [Chytriomyces sp. MP71]|nr:thioredoxin-like protein [Chytriomyces sp. MP71]
MFTGFFLLSLCLPIIASPPPIINAPSEPVNGPAEISKESAHEPVDPVRLAQEADKLLPHLTEADFNNKTLMRDGEWLLFFGSLQCGHCLNLTPKFLDLFNEKRIEYESEGLQMAKIECSTNTAFCRAQDVEVYPTLRIYEDGRIKSAFDGELEIDPLKDFVKDHFKNSGTPLSRAVKAAKEVALKVVTPDPINTNPAGSSAPISIMTHKEVMDGKNILVKFYSPRCGHCKAFRPTWINIAHTLKGKVNVGEVDCSVETHLCKKFKVRAYPTVLYVKENGEYVQYLGGRTMEDVSKFALSFIRPVFDVMVANEVKSLIQKESKSHFVFLYNHEATDLKMVEEFGKTLMRMNETIQVHLCPDKDARALFPDILTMASLQSPIFLATQGEDFERDTRAYEMSMDFKSESTRVQLKQWISEHSTQLVYRLNEDSGHTVFDGESIVVLTLLKNGDKDKVAPVTKLLRTAARRLIERRHAQEARKKKDTASVFASAVAAAAKEDKAAAATLRALTVPVEPPRKVVFAWVNSVELSAYLQHTFGVVAENIVSEPQILIVDSKEKVYYDTQQDKMTPMKFYGVSDILDHLENALDDKLFAKPTKGNKFVLLYRNSRQAMHVVKASPLLTLSGTIIFFMILLRFVKRANKSIVKGD